MFNNVTSIITDTKGNLINNDHKIHPFKKLALSNLSIQPNEKLLLVNTLDKNYSIYKNQFEIKKKKYYQYIFEEWQPKFGLNLIENKIIKKDYLINSYIDYDSFSDFEKEVIYSILNEHITDKEIYKFITNISNKEISYSIRHVISKFYYRFGVTNRSELVTIFNCNFVSYLPKSLFPAGIYKL